MGSISLHFEDMDKSAYLLRFGEKEHLEQIRDGAIRFSKLSTYRCIESGVIGDGHEGVESIMHGRDIEELAFEHPSVGTIKFNHTNPTFTMTDIPNDDPYVFCMTYFTARDIQNKTIFDERVYAEEKWDSVLFITDPTGFVENIKRSLSKYSPRFHAVRYLDYSKSQDSLDAFTKSDAYKWQREARFVVHLGDDLNENIERIDSSSIRVFYEPVQSVIIPTNEFIEGFYLDANGGIA